MRTSSFVSRSLSVSILLLVSGLFAVAGAQTRPASSGTAAAQPKPTPTLMLPPNTVAPPVAGETELYCSGFIQYAPAPNDLEIVGGEREESQRVYSQGDSVFINAGAQQGIRVGQEFSVIRPRGQFTTKLTKKKGWLGVYTQELGRLRVTEVKERISIAVVATSCETILLGDLIRAMPQRFSPAGRTELTLDHFSDPSGKQKGRIVLARDSREALSRNQVVFIDLGTEDQIKPGDYLTIYRPIGRGNITRYRDDEIVRPAMEGYDSDVFRGGKFSNQSRRVKDPNNNGIYGPTVTDAEIKRRRPPMPRKVVGEMIIIGVQARTATAVITRTTQEVHTGDFVELQ